MNARIYKILFFSFIFVIGFNNGCKKSTEIDEKNNSENLLYRGISMRTTTDSKFPYIAVHKEGSCLLIEKGSDAEVAGIVFFNNLNKGFYVKANANGLPSLAVVGDIVLVYENYTSTTVDIAVILPNKQIQIIKNVKFGTQNFLYNGLSKAQSTALLSSNLRTAGVLLSIASCTFSAVSAIVTVGVFGPLAAFACGSALLNAALYVTQTNNQALQTSGDAFSYAAGAIGCGGGDAFACVGLCLEVTRDITVASESNIVSRSNEINLASSSLTAGTGDVQVTLIWNTKADLDLYIEDPLGNTISWRSPISPTGGTLDIDDTDGYGPENIFWGKNKAPRGNYKVSLNYFNGQYSAGVYSKDYGTTNFSILVQSFGKTKTYTGSVSFGQTKSVVTFSDLSLPKISLTDDSTNHNFLNKNKWSTK